MRNLKLIGCVGFLSLALNVGPVQATILAYEGFNYANNASLVGQTGGTGWTGAWTNVSGGGAITTSLGSTYTGLPVEGNKASFVPSDSTNLVKNRQFLSSSITSGTVYFSLLIDKTNTGTQALGMNLLNNGNTQGFFGINSTQANWTASTSSPNGLALNSGVPTTSTDPTLLVFELEFNVVSGTGERLSLWVNPLLGGPQPGATVVSTATNISFTGVNGIGLVAGSNATSSLRSNGTFDEIHIGTEWADVVPEPTSLAALSFVGAAVSLRRVRSQHTKRCK